MEQEPEEQVEETVEETDEIGSPDDWWEDADNVTDITDEVEE